MALFRLLKNEQHILNFDSVTAAQKYAEENLMLDASVRIENYVTKYWRYDEGTWVDGDAPYPSAQFTP